jgi:hypothetical protein
MVTWIGRALAYFSLVQDRSPMLARPGRQGGWANTVCVSFLLVTEVGVELNTAGFRRGSTESQDLVWHLKMTLPFDQRLDILITFDSKPKLREVAAYTPFKVARVNSNAKCVRKRSR